MANGTRSAARGSKAPEPPVSTGKQVPPVASATEADLAALNRRLEMAEVLEKIAQSESRRRAFDQENLPTPVLANPGAGVPMVSTSPPLVLAVSNELAGVADEDINDIYTGKFEPWNIIRLHPLRSTRATDDEVASNVDLTSGTLVLKNKVHTIQEYLGNPAIYFSAFANYQYAYMRLFGKEHPDVDVAQNRFLAFIMQKSQVYIWARCIAYAMKHHKSVKARTIHDAAAWTDHSTVQVENFFTNLESLPRTVHAETPALRHSGRLDFHLEPGLGGFPARRRGVGTPTGRFSPTLLPSRVGDSGRPNQPPSQMPLVGPVVRC
ncbi:hypothetical protein E4U24_004540 [Claviceps purpurea]|nr:hypothetical protein E4U38_008468 [Claviceps purpurea]KAG6213068.1 hypothetical protein E4U50_001598 [Claviceps purpurea]KAG6257356.1 hypothetical protein E4U24_004540 [Claviceps purpurea]